MLIAGRLRSIADLLGHVARERPRSRSTSACGAFVHWAQWGLDPSKGSLVAGEVAVGAGQGSNDFGRRGYGGPCPPPGHGTHHYQFTLYAVGEPIALADGATIADLHRAMEGSVLTQAVLVGTYER
ncbi:MAG: YbhB/YbcL family Raf kinase inhibitor-like protein [Egibacteraceae bacterium]